MKTKKRELELYVHIPFCVQKCAYCDFLSGPADAKAQRGYLEALLQEIGRAERTENYEVSSIFIGGGTPSAVPAEYIAQILGKIKERFMLRPEAEISMEANPGTVNEKKLEVYRRSGINRLSFGCQSSDNWELMRLGRIHTWEMFLESYAMARKAGFENINVDLMSGLPGQTCQSWENSLCSVAELSPEHISAYSLIVEEGTPFASQQLVLPDEDTERSMYESTADILSGYGYKQYEISNYAKPGRECRHNMGYWQRKEYLGFGIGAASLISETRFSNPVDRKQYEDAAGDPDMLHINRERLDRKAQMEEFMFLGLRMTAGVSERRFLETFGVSMEDVYAPVIEKYVRQGFLQQNNGNLFLTGKGISVSNVILADFLL